MESKSIFKSNRKTIFLLCNDVNGQLKNGYLIMIVILQHTLLSEGDCCIFAVMVTASQSELAENLTATTVFLQNAFKIIKKLNISKKVNQKCSSNFFRHPLYVHRTKQQKTIFCINKILFSSSKIHKAKTKKKSVVCRIKNDIFW